MANIAKLEFPALNITGDNYMPWTAHVKRHLKSMGVLKTIMEENNCEEQDKAKADVFLHKHIDEMLQFEYSNCEDPYVLWKDLKADLTIKGKFYFPLLEMNGTISAEKNNELLMKNHQSRLTGSLAIPEANAATNNDTKDSGKKWVRGRGRGHFDKSHFNGRNRLFKDAQQL
ncbi:uncharacterized protein LOC143570946 [Bidens hawaiensis]|uniref:uncharacterized protein LOC143570946 n=1 Tax=Bidens hawaiensis TaxID=980011 RepID=UPI00404AA9C9